MGTNLDYVYDSTENTPTLLKGNLIIIIAKLPNHICTHFKVHLSSACTPAYCDVQGIYLASRHALEKVNKQKSRQ